MTSKAWRKERSFPSSLTFHPRRRRLAALSPEPAALTARPRVYRLGRPRARRGSRLTSAARVSSARAPVRSSVRSAVERDKQWQRHSARNADDLRSTALRAGTYLPPGTESSNPASSSGESANSRSLAQPHLSPGPIRRRLPTRFRDNAYGYAQAPGEGCRLRRVSI